MRFKFFWYLSCWKKPVTFNELDTNQHNSVHTTRKITLSVVVQPWFRTIASSNTLRKS